MYCRILNFIVAALLRSDNSAAQGLETSAPLFGLRAYPLRQVRISDIIVL